MKCVLCLQESQHGTTAEIVTGSLTKFSGTRSTYSNFQPMSLWFCDTCWRVYSAKQEANLLGNGLAVFGIGAAGLVAVLLANFQAGQQALCGGVAGLAMLGGLFYSVYGGIKKVKPTDWSIKQPSLGKPDEIFTLFKSIIPAIVYELKGKDVYFWKLSNWKEWMKPGTRTKVEVFSPRQPKEIIQQDLFNRQKLQIMQQVEKGDYKAALKSYTNREESALFCNLEGTILEKLERKHEAIIAYRRAILYNPALVEAQENFARLTN